MSYAGFWKRFLAYIIDCILSILLGVVIFLVYFNFFLPTGEGPIDFEGGNLFGHLLFLALTWIYHAGMQSSSYQATLGKMALGIKVTDLQGRRISFVRATGRYFASYLSSMIFLIGYLMIAFTEKKQALHDLIAGCLVINK